MALSGRQRKELVQTIDALQSLLEMARDSLKKEEETGSSQYREFAASRLRDAEALWDGTLIPICKRNWWGFDGEPLHRV